MSHLSKVVFNRDLDIFVLLGDNLFCLSYLIVLRLFQDLLYAPAHSVFVSREARTEQAKFYFKSQSFHVINDITTLQTRLHYKPLLQLCTQ